MRTWLVGVTAGVLAMMAGAAQGQAIQLPDGEYLCTLNPQTELGSIWIKGNTYVGPGRDPNGEAHSFEVTPSNTVNWSSPMGGMDTDGNRVVGTELKKRDDGHVAFDIQFQTETGHFHMAACEPR